MTLIDFFAVVGVSILVGALTVLWLFSLPRGGAR